MTPSPCRINHQPIPVLIDLHGRLHAAASR